jgi:hypothetical protein
MGDEILVIRNLTSNIAVWIAVLLIFAGVGFATIFLPSLIDLGCLGI